MMSLDFEAIDDQKSTRLIAWCVSLNGDYLKANNLKPETAFQIYFAFDGKTALTKAVEHFGINQDNLVLRRTPRYDCYSDLGHVPLLSLYRDRIPLICHGKQCSNIIENENNTQGLVFDDQEIYCSLGCYTTKSRTARQSLSTLIKQHDYAINKLFPAAFPTISATNGCYDVHQNAIYCLGYYDKRRYPVEVFMHEGTQDIRVFAYKDEQQYWKAHLSHVPAGHLTEK